MTARTRLFACIISPETAERPDALKRIAGNFAHAIEMLEDGVLFDVSGLERLVGKADRVAEKILRQMKRGSIPGNVAVADTPDAAILLARQKQAEACTLTTGATFGQIPLVGLGLERDTLGVFNDLGLKSIDDLLAVPKDDLVGRYGREFEAVIKRIRQKGDRLIAPNVKESKVSWSFNLDHAVEDFEQLIFIVNHGLDDLFARVATYAKSTEQLDISFRLTNRTVRHYEIKTSFPTLDRAFWLKLINLRVGLHPPEAAILSVDVTAHFTKPRPSQKGLYAVSRPEPESLLLTVGKLKKLVGETNVGMPVLLDQRLARSFQIDTEKLPDVSIETSGRTVDPFRIATLTFFYYRPAKHVEVLVRNKQMVFVRSRDISGHVLNCSGVWKGNSQWWGKPWATNEWDVEIENGGVYRIVKSGEEWFVVGEYD